VAQFCDRHFAQDLKIDLLNARLPNGTELANHPGFNKAILEVARIVDPRGSQLPNASGAGLSNVESRIAEIEGKYMRAAHGSDQWKAYWTGDSGARMQQEYRGIVARGGVRSLSYRRAAAPRTARLSEVGGRLALVPLRAISMSLRCLRVATRASASMAR
jgi:hypothetical protein